MLIPLENAISPAYLNTAGYSLGIDPCLLQQTRNFRRMVYAGAEYNSFLSTRIFHVCVYYKLIALRNEQLAFKVLRVVLYAVYAHIGKVDVRLDPHAADRRKYSLLYCGPEVHFVRDILTCFSKIVSSSVIM